MNNESPKVSIIMATYNRANYIGLTIDSLLFQKYLNYEIIIVDDGGDDNTMEILEAYLKDPRINFYKRPKEYPKGCSGSRNFGLTKAIGELIWFFDDDDIAHPYLLELCIKALTKNIAHDFCRFERTVFYNFEEIEFNYNNSFEIKSVSKENLKQLITGELPFNSCQVIWRRSALGSEEFRADILYSDDWEFYSRLLSLGLKGVSINKTLLFARKHFGSTTHKYKSGNKKILDTVLLANYSVIDLAVRENIMDSELFKFFYRKLILFNSYPIIKYLIEKSNLNYWERIKYKFGFYAYPVLKPIFFFKSKIK